VRGLEDERREGEPYLGHEDKPAGTADGILSARKASTTTTTPVTIAFTSGPRLNDSTYGETISQTPIASTIGTIDLLTKGTTPPFRCLHS
jgi:hypothetical protein